MPEDSRQDPFRTLNAEQDPAATLAFSGELESTNDLVVRPPPPAGAPTLAGYAITAEIAKGGMGRVFAAHDLVLDREVAIKTLLPGSEASRFVIEAKITARLPHPAIPPVYELGKLDDGTPFLAMKLIRGQTLAALLHTRESPHSDLGRFLQIFEQIAHAVGFAHAQGIIHRDLKPQNVMVGAFGEVQVMDWGLAKSLANHEPGLDVSKAMEFPPEEMELTSAGAVMGTPSYMSPEQARGEVLDARTDVFALGSILTAILTGKPAFLGASSREIVQRAADGEVADAVARLRTSDADAELIQLAERSLAAAAAERTANARLMADEIGAYRQGVELRLRTAETERAAALVREAEQSKRRRVLQWSAGLVASVLLLGIVGTSIGMYRADQGRRAAETAEQKTAAQLLLTQQAESRERAAKEDVSAKKVELERSLVIVGERTGLALDAFNQMVYGVQNKLEVRAGTQELRRELLETARSGLQKILDEARKQGRPDQTLVWSRYRMGDVERELGNTTRADAEYRAGLELARELAIAEGKKSVDRETAVGHQKLGEITLQLGKPRLALEHYLTGLKQHEQNAASQPNDSQIQEDLEIALDRLGDVCTYLGQNKEAAAYYQRSMQVVERKIARFGVTPQTQVSLVISYEKLGDVWLEAGNAAEAVGYYTKAVQIAEQLLAADPDNAHRQQSLSTQYNELATATRQAGRVTEALELHRKALAIDERRLAADPRNARVQRDMGTTLERVANCLQTLGRTDQALREYEKMLQMKQRVVDQDPNDGLAQRELAVTYRHLGNISVRLANSDQAVVHFQKSLDICERLAELDGDSVMFQQDLSQSYFCLSNLFRATGRLRESLALHELRLATHERLVLLDPDGVKAELGLASAYRDMSQAKADLGRTQEARDDLLKAIGTIERLAESNPNVIRVQYELASTLQNFGQIQIDSGNRQQALATFQKMLAVVERLSAASPDDFRMRQALGVAYVQIGDIHQELWQSADAVKWLEKALAIANEATQRDPASVENQVTVAAIKGRLSVSLVDLGKSREALTQAESQLAICEQLLVVAPQHAGLSKNRIEAHLKMAIVQQALHNFTAAGEWYDKAIALIEPLHKAGKLPAALAEAWLPEAKAAVLACKFAEDPKADFDTALQQTSDVARLLLEARVKALLHRQMAAAALALARRQAEWAVTQPADKREQNYFAARSLALCTTENDGEQERILEQTLSLLEQSREAGFFDPRQTALLKQDPDFNALRDSPKFSAFLEKLQAATLPTPP